jgi:hypothetical protein
MREVIYTKPTEFVIGVRPTTLTGGKNNISMRTAGFSLVTISHSSSDLCLQFLNLSENISN